MLASSWLASSRKKQPIIFSVCIGSRDQVSLHYLLRFSYVCEVSDRTTAPELRAMQKTSDDRLITIIITTMIKIMMIIIIRIFTRVYNSTCNAVINMCYQNVSDHWYCKIRKPGLTTDAHFAQRLGLWRRISDSKSLVLRVQLLLLFFYCPGLLLLNIILLCWPGIQY